MFVKKLCDLGLNKTDLTLVLAKGSFSSDWTGNVVVLLLCSSASLHIVETHLEPWFNL